MSVNIRDFVGTYLTPNGITVDQLAAQMCMPPDQLRTFIREHDECRLLGWQNGDALSAAINALIAANDG